MMSQNTTHEDSGLGRRFRKLFQKKTLSALVVKAERVFSPQLVGFLLAMVYAFAPSHIRGTLNLVALYLEQWVSPKQGYFHRDTENAMSQPDGLVEVGGALTSDHLIEAYRRGVYPHRHVGPYKWYSPQARAVGMINETHIEKNVRRALRQKKYKVTFDTAFEEVMRACAEPRPGKVHLTWIHEDTINAYVDLYRLGHAHSVEVWDENEQLVGGLYGVVSGAVFVTESQFSHKRDASKVAYATLNRQLAEWGFVANDGKIMTDHLGRLGMREIFRNEYIRLLERTQGHGTPKKWHLDPDLDVADWHPTSTPL